MKTPILSVVCLMALLIICPLINAQEQSPAFNLPAAQVGKVYRADIPVVLSEQYRLKVDGAGSQGGAFLWSFADGELPPGLAVDPHGLIIGTPESARENEYRFALNVRDDSKSDALRLLFIIQLKAGGLRLTKIDGSSGPRLIPTVAVATDLSADPNNTANGNGARESTRGSRRELDAKPDDAPAATKIDWHSLGESNDNFLEGEKTLEVTVTDEKREICLLNVVVQDSQKQVLVNNKFKVDYNKEFQTLKVGLGKGYNDIFVSAWKKKATSKNAEKIPNSVRSRPLKKR